MKQQGLDAWLDRVHAFIVELEQATRRKKKWNRERITSIVSVSSTILSTLAFAFPGVKGLSTVSRVIGILQLPDNLPQEMPEPTHVSVLTDTKETL